LTLPLRIRFGDKTSKRSPLNINYSEKKKIMNLETINKIKEWGDKEISDENKYPIWFLECGCRTCNNLKRILKLKVIESKKENGNGEGGDMKIGKVESYQPSPRARYDW